MLQFYFKMGAVLALGGFSVFSGIAPVAADEVTKTAVAPAAIPVGVRNYLVKNGEATGKIYLPENSTPLAMLAADELRTFIKAMTGAEMEIAYNDLNHFEYGRPYFTQISLEIRPKAEWEGKESPQAFTIETLNRSNSSRQIIRGNSPLGLLYGVYQFLFEQGIRFYTPEPDGTFIPKKNDLPMLMGKKSYTPDIELRSMNYSGLDNNAWDTTLPGHHQRVKDYTRWYLRNRLMLERNIDSGDYPFIRLSHGGGHSLSGARANADFAREPERFPMKNGKRYKGGQICWSNGKNVDAAVANAIKVYDEIKTKGEKNKYDLTPYNNIVDISLFDWGGALCECPECTLIAGEEPNKVDRLVWSFMNKVAKNVAAQRPNCKLLVFAPYLELTRPPADVKLEPNLIAQACRSEAWENKAENREFYPFTKVYSENVKATADAGAEMAVYEYILWQGTPQPLDVLDAIAEYKKYNVSYYHTETMQRNDLWLPIFWSMANVLFDSSKTPREFLQDFCQNYYGEKNGSIVFEFYHDLTENGKLMERRIYGGLESTSALFTDDLIKKYRSKFMWAANNAVGPEREHIVRFGNAFESAAQMAEIYRAHCKALNDRTDEAINDVKKRYNNYQKLIPKIREFSGPDNWTLLEPINKIDYKTLKPVLRKDLAEDEERYLTELFARDVVPDEVENLFKLPEVWLFRCDPWLEGQKKGFASLDYDVSRDKWQNVSAWDVFES
ncbi:MAG: DUF4838 domain-containing protein, partial [Lentisphaeria bacterium]|nr:DUF4838 domain-containing protein [Lentisphaeria bacterium]